MDTDEQIRDGFDELVASATPPADAAARVAARIATRRRRRRARGAVATAAALAAVGVAAFAVTGRNEGTVAEDPTDAGGSLVMTRADGSQYAFGDVTVECATDEAIDDSGKENILAYTRRVEDGRELGIPWFYFRAAVSDLENGRTYEVPGNIKEGIPLTVFIADVPHGGPEGNEVVGGMPGADGTVRVLEARCGPEPTLRLELDATLGSEVRQDPIHLRGTVG